MNPVIDLAKEHSNLTYTRMETFGNELHNLWKYHSINCLKQSHSAYISVMSLLINDLMID